MATSRSIASGGKVDFKPKTKNTLTISLYRKTAEKRLGFYEDTMATSRSIASGGKVGFKPKVTANQLGYKVNSLVVYKNSPYHIVAIDRTGTLLTIKKCEKPNVVRDDIGLDSVRLVATKDALYHKWGLVPVKSDFTRTREDELFIIKALVDACANCGKEARRDLLIDNIKSHPWLGVWLRACYDEDRIYRLLPKHVKAVKDRPRVEAQGIFNILTQLQYNKLKPIRAAREWLSMLEEMDRDVWRIANMVLTKQFGNITYSDARFAMKETGCVPWLPNRKQKGLIE
jgi:hypothetical protein